MNKEYTVLIIGKLNSNEHNLWNKIPFLKRYNKGYENNIDTTIKLKVFTTATDRHYTLKNAEIFISTYGVKKDTIFEHIKNFDKNTFIEFIEMLNVFGYSINKNSTISKKYKYIDLNASNINTFIHHNTTILINKLYKNIFNTIQNEDTYNITDDEINNLTLYIIPNIPYSILSIFIKRLHPLSNLIYNNINNFIESLIYDKNNKNKTNTIHSNNYVIFTTKTSNEEVKDIFKLPYNNDEYNKKIILLISEFYIKNWTKYNTIYREDEFFKPKDVVYRNIEDIEF